ncbi:FtsW/RodA/SpoVE family cell cycle protein [Candidatus Parcubacteria bacterium]|nr:FtsW/RodA/SpoVE family cell cycle protein [Candidatus Parcubacteria bacterium]
MLSHFKKLDWLLIFVVFLLSVLGLIEILSASRGNFLNFKKQVFFVIFGFFLMFLVSFFDWRTLRETKTLIFFFYFLSLFLLLGLFLFAPKVRGTKTWYKILLFSFDPSEIAKISLLLILANYFSFKHPQIYKLFNIFISGIYFLAPALLVFLQPNFGGFLIFFFLWIFILIFSGIKTKHFFLLLFIFVLFFAFSFEKILKPYQKERILSFLFPQLSDPLKSGWSQKQALIAIGSGGVFGKGFFQGSQVQLGFLPEPQGDFIFSAFAEETGFLGVLLLLLLYFVLFWRILKIGFNSNSNFAKLFAVGFFATLICQTFLHLGSNLKLLPVIGVTLPFFGYGGSNLISNFLLLGILMSIKVNE